jgi:hypothetical protein
MQFMIENEFGLFLLAVANVKNKFLSALEQYRVLSIIPLVYKN